MPLLSAIGTVFLGALIGVLMGFIGGGGGTVYLLLLTFVLRLPVHTAVGTSLVLATLTSVSALATHWRAGRVAWKPGLWLGGFSAVSAAAATYLVTWIPETVLKGLVLTAMVVVSLPALKRLRSADEEVAPPSPAGFQPGHIAAGLLLGLGAGGLGLSGTAPLSSYLTTFGRMPVEAALGTAVMATLITTASASTTHLVLASVNLPMVALLGGGAVAGGYVGAMLVGKVNRRVLLGICSSLTIFTVIGLVFGLSR